MHKAHFVSSGASGNTTPAMELTPGPSSSVTSFMLDSRAPPSQYAKEEEERDDNVEKEIERLMHETRIWRVANSAQLVAWGIVQAKVPGMDEALARLRARKRNMPRKILEKISGKAGTARTDDEPADDVHESNADGAEAAEGEEEDAKPSIPHEHETDDDGEFDYLAYAQDRALFFWGDMLELGLVKEADLPEEVVKAAKRVPY